MQKNAQNEMVTLADGRTVELSDIVDNPEKYGFIWEYEHLMKNGSRVTMGRGAPRKKHVDMALCMSTFGSDYFLDSANGTSARVKDQTIRAELADNVPLRNDERGMCEWIIRNTLGTKARKPSTVVIEKTTYVGLDGSEYATLAECQAANLAHLVDAGMAVTDARAVLGI